MSGLDNWITGHYGEDQFRGRESESVEDEGLLVLQSAMKYLRPRADVDEDEQLTGEYEAWAILSSAYDAVLRDYQCHFCGEAISRKNDKYCSWNCCRADRED